MQILFYKPQFLWPPRCGGTVHTGNLMKSLAAQGHDITLATERPIDEEAAKWLNCVTVEVLPSGELESSQELEGNWANRKLANYWGFQRSTSHWLQDVVKRKNVDAIIAVGIGTLVYLDFTKAIKRIWYPADDPVLHAVSLVNKNGVSLSAIRHASINIAYQRMFRRHVDAAWVVSPRDQRWMRRTGGMRNVDVIPNGVDAEYYSPCNVEQEPNSCIFWGRLDFQPNVDAIEWFLDRVWPGVKYQVPTATFHVCGSHPLGALKQRLEAVRGVQFHENLDDLRPTINAAAVSVFPMVSGAGVKNKVLEAAAMAKPICGTDMCLNGLSTKSTPPLRLPRTPDEWTAELLSLWSDAPMRIAIGELARRWVLDNHSWENSADAALNSLAGLNSTTTIPVTTSHS